jgi:MFS family permease
MREAVGSAVSRIPVTGPLLHDAISGQRDVTRAEAKGIRTFLLIWFGQLISLLGSGLTGFSLGVWVYQRTGSATQFAMIAVAIVLPNIIFLPFAGALADRWDRRQMMLISTAGAGLSSLSIVVLLLTGYIEVWHVYVATVFRSLFNTLQIPAYSSLPSLLVPKKHLVRASGLVQTAQAAASIISPFVAGALIVSIGLQGVILIDLATYAFAIFTLLIVTVPRPQAAKGTGALMREAIGKVRANTGSLVREAVSKGTGGTGRLRSASLGRTGLLVQEAVGKTGRLVREAVSNVRLDDDRGERGHFSSTSALAGTAPLMTETVSKPADGKPSFLRDSVYGWTFIKERRGLLIMLITFAGVNFALGTAQVLFTPLVLSFSTPQTLSRVTSCAGLGLLTGSLMMSIWGGPKRRLVGATAGAVLMGICVMCTGLRPDASLIAVGMFGMLFSSPLLNGCTQAIWQTKTPVNVQGRVFAVRRMIAQCTSPLAFCLAGPLADNVFEPLLAENGALSDTVGRIIGQGQGRGIGFMFVLSGTLVAMIALLAYLNPRVRLVETEIKDAT